MKKQLLIVTASACLTLAGCATTGGNVDLKQVGKVFGSAYDSVRSYSPEEEEEIGSRVMADLLGAAPLVRDPALQRYVNQVGHWIALQSDKPGLTWRFGVTNDPHVNSFAAPSGYILITKGLFDLLKTEAELATVLAHEITHVTKGHHVRAMKATARGGLVTGLAKVGAQASGKQGADLAANAFSGGTEIFTRGFDKQDEYDADVGGMVLAARAGYNPYALPSVLNTLSNINPKDDAVALLFQTHPKTNDRLDKIDASIGTKLEPYAGGVENTPSFARFSKAKK